MDRERWQRIQDLYHSAVKLDPERRAGYLRAQCGGDQALLLTLESLFENRLPDDSLLEVPAFELAARDMAGDADGDPPARNSLIGSVVANFKILEQLGAGGMGVVYKALDLKLRRQVALKFLPEALACDPVAVDRFRREARAASALNHPGICTVHDIGEHKGNLFIVMELLEGETLTRRIGGQPLPLGQVLRWGADIADALGAAHARGIIHRDIKPGNIFINQAGRMKILDFGMAKLLPEQAILAGDLYTDTNLTATGVPLGTYAYMSPEQARGQQLDARTDLFSFGAVLYEMATGVAAFHGKSLADTLQSILSGRPWPITIRNPTMPARLQEITARCLEKDPSQRYQSAAEIRTDLEDADRSVGEPVQSKPHKRRRAGKQSQAAVPASNTFWVRLGKKRLLAVGIVLASILALLAYFHFHPAGKLTAKDTIVLADFTNTTGDTVFDGTLRQGLSIQLEQSPFLSVIPNQRVQQTLQMMGQKPDAKLTPEIAQGVCQRTASVVIDGSIAQIGAQYLLTLKATNCSTGESLASTEAQANDKTHVLEALGEASSEIRKKLGESLTTVQKFDTPLWQGTTPSLEALQAYDLGGKTATGKSDWAGAVPFFQKAVRLDPKFAAAYAALGNCYSNLGESTLGSENTRRAFELRANVTEWERLFIETRYHIFVTGNLEKAQNSFAVWTQTYPRDWVPRHDMGSVYYGLGQYEKSLMLFRDALRLYPESSMLQVNVVWTYVRLNRFEEAQAALVAMETKNQESADLGELPYVLAFLRNDAIGMEQQDALTAGKLGLEHQRLGMEADTAAYSGRLDKARGLSRQAVASAGLAEEKEAASGYEAAAALREALFGNAREAQQWAANALRRSAGRDVQYWATLALVLARDPGRSKVLADDLRKRFPEDTFVQFNYLPTIHAELALKSNDAPRAIAALQTAVPYELGAASLYPAYTRGLAFLAGHRGGEAAVEFRKILEHRGIVLNDPIGALAHLQIGRAYALTGDTAKAKAAYQDFLTLWKDADQDIPILRQAKAEYAKLQ